MNIRAVFMTLVIFLVIGSIAVVMPHAAHAPFISHPTQTADIISNFVHNLAIIDKRCS